MLYFCHIIFSEPPRRTTGSGGRLLSAAPRGATPTDAAAKTKRSGRWKGVWLHLAVPRPAYKLGPASNRRKPQPRRSINKTCRARQGPHSSAGCTGLPDAPITPWLARAQRLSPRACTPALRRVAPSGTPSSTRVDGCLLSSNCLPACLGRSAPTIVPLFRPSATQQATADMAGTRAAWPACRRLPAEASRTHHARRQRNASNWSLQGRGGAGWSNLGRAESGKTAPVPRPF